MATVAKMCKVMRKSLVSRTLERCKSGLSGGAGPVAGCFSVYVGRERQRFVVRTECASHPLFRRLLDDAEREYGYASQGPLVLPCDVASFVDVLWQMNHDNDDDGCGGDDKILMAVASSSPMCGLQLSCGSKGREAAGYLMLSQQRRLR